MKKVDQILEYYLTVYAAKDEWTKSTIGTKTYRLTKFIEHCNISRIKDINQDVLNDWADSLVKRNLAASTREQEIILVRSFLTWLLNKGYSLDIDLTEFKPNKSPEPERRAYTEIEVTCMLEACKHEEDWLIIALGFYGGLRIFEVAKIAKNDISGRVISLYGKGRKYAQVILPAFVTDRLHNWCKGNDSPWVFPSRRKGYERCHISKSSIDKKIKRIGAQSGFPEAHYHELRYSLATEMKNRGAKLHSIQKALRHENIKTTEKYIQWDFKEYVTDYDSCFSTNPRLKLAIV